MKTEPRQAKRSPAKNAPAKKSAAKKAAPLPKSTGFWLLKSEPDVFSWSDLVARGAQGEPWDGVRNYLARNNMRAMKIGDLGFFYHSNEGKEVVGICEVCALAHPDPKDESGTWECVDVRAVVAMPRPVTLVEVKANEKLSSMSLVTSMRLSVQPVTKSEWAEVCRMGDLDPKSIRG
jgi:predicted RNA-binding protein with PUA-like domain